MQRVQGSLLRHFVDGAWSDEVGKVEGDRVGSNTPARFTGVGGEGN
jgi:hypothetical protein